MANMSRSFKMWPRHETHRLLSDYTPENFKKVVYSSWRSIVQNYSRRSLTKQPDLLPAIRSIAEDMTASINQTYIPCAGMWKEHLGHDLLWQVDDGPVSSPAAYRAPSWSWASLTAKIQWNESPISSIEPSLEHEDFRKWAIERRFGKYGQWQYATEGRQQVYTLEGRALLREITSISHCDDDDRWLFGTRGTFPYDVRCTQNPSTYHTSAISKTSDEFSELSLGTSRELGKFAEARLDFDDKDNLTDSFHELYYMHVTYANRPSGLILKRHCTENDNECRFERVGVATVFDLAGKPFMESCFRESTSDHVIIL
jgi:hypothetical protein